MKNLILEGRKFIFGVSKEYGNIYHHYDFTQEYNFTPTDFDDFDDSPSLCSDEEAETAYKMYFYQTLKKRKKNVVSPPKKLSFYEKLKMKFLSIPFIAKYNAKKVAKNEKEEYQKILKSLGIDERQLYCAGVIKDCHT